MAFVVKGLILVLCALVVFARNIFPSVTLYWLTFATMFALVPVWWLTEYWVSEKKAGKVLNEEIKKSFFVRMPSEGVGDDFIRGRLCICNDSVKFVSKTGSSFKTIFEIKISQITYLGLSDKIAGRKGFVISTNKKEYNFNSQKADEVIGAIK